MWNWHSAALCSTLHPQLLTNTFTGLWLGFRAADKHSDIQNRCSEKIHKAHKKILVFEYFFNKIVSWRPAILLISLICLLKRREKCSCFLVNFAKFSQQAFNRTHLVCLSRRISHLWIGANNIKVNLTRYIFCKNRSHFYSETRRNFEQVATNWLIDELSVAS